MELIHLLLKVYCKKSVEAFYNIEENNNEYQYYFKQHLLTAFRRLNQRKFKCVLLFFFRKTICYQSMLENGWIVGAEMSGLSQI